MPSLTTNDVEYLARQLVALPEGIEVRSRLDPKEDAIEIRLLDRQANRVVGVRISGQEILRAGWRVHGVIEREVRAALAQLRPPPPRVGNFDMTAASAILRERYSQASIQSLAYTPAAIFGSNPVAHYRAPDVDEEAPFVAKTKVCRWCKTTASKHGERLCGSCATMFGGLVAGWEPPSPPPPPRTAWARLLEEAEF